MKKHFLPFALAILVSTAFLSKSYGQLTVPRVVDPVCLPSDALHPIAGHPYNYVIEVPAPAGTKEYTWFVTQDKNFITAPGTLTATREAAAGNFLSVTGAGYNDPAAGASTLALTWKTFAYDPVNPVFVVIQVKSTVAGACNPNNLKVFKIIPVNAFTLDIANMKLDNTVAAYETNIDRCISNIVSATYDPTAAEGVKYDYGVDYLYFAVTAANFSTSWQPSLKVNTIDANETVTAVEWFRAADLTFTTPEAMPLTGGIYTATNPVTVLDATGAVGSAGESIIIRVTIDHTTATKQYEGITDETITVAVDGKTLLSSATPLGDVHFSSTIGTAADCGKEDAFNNDIATQILKARPEITATTMPAPGILPVKL